MKINTLTAWAWAITAMAGSAVAADNQSSETQSSQTTAANQSTAGEIGKLDVGSIHRRGDLARFEVTRSNDTSAADRIRYVVDCKQGKLAVAAKADTDATPPEVSITPPRTADWRKPPAGSEQAQWVDRACRS